MGGVMLPEGGVSAAGGTFLAPGPVSRTADLRGAGEGLLLGRATFRSGVARSGVARSGVAVADAGAGAGSRGRSVPVAFFVLATTFLAAAFFG
jgi:hypothetical protein